VAVSGVELSEAEIDCACGALASFLDDRCLGSEGAEERSLIEKLRSAGAQKPVRDVDMVEGMLKRAEIRFRGPELHRGLFSRFIETIDPLETPVRFEFDRDGKLIEVRATD
jgi:hypothetical protein